VGIFEVDLEACLLWRLFETLLLSEESSPISKRSSRTTAPGNALNDDEGSDDVDGSTSRSMITLFRNKSHREIYILHCFGADA
jgi:hypothetical protein